MDTRARCRSKLNKMLKKYFTKLYQRTMTEAYGLASDEIMTALSGGGNCLDCGANKGYWYQRLSSGIGLDKNRYQGIEWDSRSVEEAQKNNIEIIQGDLNAMLPFDENQFHCVFALSVLEHLLKPCHFLRESHRVLTQGGKLILLTPNISTYFTAVLIIAGKMPSSGPHPDSNNLLKSEELFKVSSEQLQWDTEAETPVHRHLVVFSYLVLRKYLKTLGFQNVRGYGFGLYPFPNFIQPVLEKIDPYHCHQMVFIAEKQ